MGAKAKVGGGKVSGMGRRLAARARKSTRRDRVGGTQRVGAKIARRASNVATVEVIRPGMGYLKGDRVELAGAGQPVNLAHDTIFGVPAHKWDAMTAQAKGSAKARWARKMAAEGAEQAAVLEKLRAERVTIEASLPSSVCGFGDALAFMRAGMRVRRRGWNGKGMFVYLVRGSVFEVNRAPLLGIYPEGTVVGYRAHIDMRDATGCCVPWLASQTDLLAEDWEVAT